MRDDKYYYVYLLTNFTNSTIYTGVTNNLIGRVQQHREKSNEGFTNRYNVWKLVYFEQTREVFSALEREKQIKAGPRKAKVALVESTNPQVARSLSRTAGRRMKRQRLLRPR